VHNKHDSKIKLVEIFKKKEGKNKRKTSKPVLVFLKFKKRRKSKKQKNCFHSRRSFEIVYVNDHQGGTLVYA